MGINSKLRRYMTNPIVIRELKTVLRKASSFISPVLFALFSMVVIMIIWDQFRLDGGIQSANGLTEASRILFMLISYGILAIASLVVLLSTSASISSERENKTFELLVASGLSRTQILMGKLISALGYVFFLVFVTLPITSICFLMGGVGFEELFTAYVAIFTTLAATGMIGIMCSAFCSNSKKATAVAFLIVLLLYFVLPIGIESWKQWIRYRGRGLNNLNVFVAFNPYLNFAMLFLPANAFPVSFPGTIGRFSPLTRILLSNVGVFALMFLIAAKFFITPERMRTKVRKKYIKDKKTLEQRRKGFPYYIIDPLKKNEEIRDNQCPAYMKEKRYTFASKIVFIIRFGYLVFIVGLFLALLTFFSGGREGIMMTSMIGMGIGAIFSINLSSSAIVEEEERETFELLRSTLITPQQCFLAKMRFTLKNTFIILAAFLAPSLLFSFVGGTYVRGGGLDVMASFWIIGLTGILMSVVLGMGIGFFFSTFKISKARAQTGALIAFILVSLVPVGIMGSGAVFDMYFDVDISMKDLEGVGNFLAGFLSPFHFVAVGFDKIHGNWNWRRSGRVLEFPVSYIFFGHVSFVLFSAFFYRMIFKRFRRIWFEGFTTKPVSETIIAKLRKVFGG